MTVPRKIVDLVRKRAKYRCEYCHYPEFLSTSPLTIDHIFLRSLGGTDEINNLALAYRRCNERHYNFVSGIDPQTQQEESLFNPRISQWSKHFIWTVDGTKINGLPAIGRTICDRLDLNDERLTEHFIQRSRRLWKQGGWHPPKDDPCL